MTLEKIFDQYTIGSDGFVAAVQTYCGFNISNDEVRRIAETAKTANEFQDIWENKAYWVQHDL